MKIARCQCNVNALIHIPNILEPDYDYNRMPPLAGKSPAVPSTSCCHGNLESYRDFLLNASVISVPARHISEGATLCPYCLAPELPCALPDLHSTLLALRLDLKKKLHIYNFDVLCFQTTCRFVSDLFHRSPTKLCPDLVWFAY